MIVNHAHVCLEVSASIWQAKCIVQIALKDTKVIAVKDAKMDILVTQKGKMDHELGMYV